MILKILICCLPWRFKRLMLQKCYGYELDRTAKIGLSWVYPKHLIMKEHSKIDHFTIAVNLDCIRLEKNATVGRNNWITGFPTKSNSKHFKHQPNRKAELIINESSSITKNHHLDCTNSLHIGKFVTIAGYQSQFLTHSIDVFDNIQDSKPITIGDYTFVGTNSVILGGAKLPPYSVLGAKSLLNKAYDEEWKLYGGVPAKPISNISKSAKYFSRKEGYVY